MPRKAEQGISVLVLEAYEHIGGGARSAELTLPGFTRGMCGYHAASLALRRIFGRTKARIAGPRTRS